MNIKITINTDNAAFFEQGRTAETINILRGLIANLKSGLLIQLDNRIPLLDSNGNIVGYLTVKK